MNIPPDCIILITTNLDIMSFIQFSRVSMFNMSLCLTKDMLITMMPFSYTEKHYVSKLLRHDNITFINNLFKISHIYYKIISTTRDFSIFNFINVYRKMYQNEDHSCKPMNYGEICDVVSFHCPNIKTIKCNGSNIPKLHKLLPYSPCLTSLTVKDGILRTFTLPDVIANQLKELTITCSNLQILSNEYPNLTHLDISHNMTRDVPSVIFNMSKLNMLNISCNTMTTFPNEICDMTLLQNLSLGNYQTPCQPPKLCNLTNLTSLELINVLNLPPNLDDVSI